MLHQTRRRSCKRAGYTLTEMLIVSGVLASLAAMSWPVLRGPLNKSRLRNAAKQVRVELAKTRLKAIQTGVAHQFRYQPGDNQFEIAPLETESGAETPAYGWAEDDSDNSPAAADSDTERATQLHAVCRQLPEGVQFVDPALADDETPGDEPLAQEPQTDDALEEHDWSAPIVFRPNGRAANARIQLAGVRDFRVEVALRGLTGVVTVGPLQRNGPLQREEEQP